MKNRLVSFALLVGLLSVCGSLFAHHGSAAYSDKAITLKDVTVTRFVWANPHSIVMFDVKDDKGSVVHWAGEAGSPSALSLIGWSKSSLQPGDVVTIYIFQSKAGTAVGRLNRIMLADGTALRDSQLGGDAYKGAAEKPQP
jgi:uncharacterized protein DUF6152